MADETNCGVTANFALPLAHAPYTKARWRCRPVAVGLDLKGRVGMRSIGVFIACAGVLLSLTAAYGLPKRIILLRHAEKIDGGGLCHIGERRAVALKEQYLGKGAQKSLFGAGEQPAVFYAITGHSKDTIQPTSDSWGNDVALMVPDKNYKRQEGWEDLWTKQAAKDVLTNKDYNGKVVVMAWEHHRIADATLPEGDTLRHLLGIDSYADNDAKNWSKNWCGSNYDFFWIVDYDPGANYDPKSGPPTPIKITPVKQDFIAPYDDVPNNKRGDPEPKDAFQGCTDTPRPDCEKP